jgi:hypothetical protein
VGRWRGDARATGCVEQARTLVERRLFELFVAGRDYEWRHSHSSAVVDRAQLQICPPIASGEAASVAARHAKQRLAPVVGGASASNGTAADHLATNHLLVEVALAGHVHGIIVESVLHVQSRAACRAARGSAATSCVRCTLFV